MHDVRRFSAIGLLLAGALLASSAFARWEYKGANAVLGVYTDAESVHEVEGRRRIKMLHDFKQPQRDRSGLQYQSTLFFIEFDCSGNTLAIYSTVKFRGPMASGGIAHTDGGNPLLTSVVRPSSAESSAREVACAVRPGLGPVGPDISLWAGRGAQAAQTAPAAGRQQAPQKHKSELELFRDLGADKPIGVSAAQSQSGNSPFTNSDVAKACETQIRYMVIGYQGGMDVYKVEVLPPVKPSQSGLSASSIPQTDLMYPAKVHVHYENGGGRRWTQVFLYKTPFGTKCMSAN